MAEVTAPQRVGGGFVDYTDNDYAAGTYLPLLAGQTVQLTRDLSPSASNTRLNAPWAGFSFWDNTAKLLKARALNDTLDMSSAIRVVSDKIGGVLRIQMVTADGQIVLAAMNQPLLAAVGDEESLTVVAKLAVRPRFASIGAKIMLTSTVNATLREFSPVFYPTGYDA